MPRSGLMLSAALTLTMSLSAVAEADIAMTLQPDSGWAVSKIGGGATAGGGAYCALARRYSNGMVMTLARNAQDESSMAIDFQRDGALDPGASYDVTLKPGAEQGRNFNVRPVSGRALVVRLGKDYAFYDALNRTPTLNVVIGNDTYAFSMANFDSGAQQLNSCLTGLGAPAASPVAAAPASPAPASLTPAPPPPSVTAEMTPVPDLPLKIVPAPIAEAAALAPAVDDLRAKNDALKTSLEKARRELADKDKQDDKATTAELALNDKLEKLQEENDALRQQTAAAPAGASDDDLRQLKDQNALLLQQLDAVRAQAAR